MREWLEGTGQTSGQTSSKRAVVASPERRVMAGCGERKRGRSQGTMSPTRPRGTAERPDRVVYRGRMGEGRRGPEPPGRWAEGIELVGPWEM